MFDRLYRILWGNLYFPYYFPASPSTSRTNSVHRWAAQHCFSSYPLFISVPLRLLMAFLWPFKLIQLIHQSTSRCGPAVAQQEGISVCHQVLQQLSIGMRHRLQPLEYYRYALYRKDRRRLVSHYLLQHEVLPLSVKLNHRQQDTEAQWSIINDKGIFASFCREHDLPSPAIVGAFGNQQGLPPMPNLQQHGPGISIYIKPRQASRGRGASVWLYHGNGLYARAWDGEAIPWSELESHVRKPGEKSGLIVQPMLNNHSAIAALSVNAVSIARIVTGLTPDQKVIPIAATFKMASGPKQLNSTIGLNSAIDLQTGELGPAYRYSPLFQPCDHHPVTGAPITGVKLPDWSGALELVRKAHQHLQNHTFLGWDVALTTTGPVLLEGNSGWETLMVQRPQQTPLGLTPFTDICLLWMNAEPVTRRYPAP